MTRLVLGPVMVGRPIPFRGEEMSAIAKQAVAGPADVGPLGIAGDEQADRLHHGGVDMAIHHYPLDHYTDWVGELGGHLLLSGPGAFGENISTSGLTEAHACIGDRFRLGSALVEISQGRKPCWKIDHKFQRKGITARVVETGRCGWYYRVLEPGKVAEGDVFELVERGHEEWSVARCFGIIVAGAHRGEPAVLAELAALPRLSADWKARARALMG